MSAPVSIGLRVDGSEMSEMRSTPGCVQECAPLGPSPVDVETFVHPASPASAIAKNTHACIFMGSGRSAKPRRAPVGGDGNGMHDRLRTDGGAVDARAYGPRVFGRPDLARRAGL